MMNERSPLAHEAETEHEHEHSDEGDWDVLDQDPNVGRPRETLSILSLFTLTLATFGLQIGWSVELAQVTPFLLSLGLNKAVLAIVWIAGPLTGTIVQPYVGKWSDNSSSKWGRRRPFCIVGAIGTGLTLFILSRIRTLSVWFYGLFGAESDSPAVRITAQLLAILLVYVLDFFINLLQAALRAFVVDCTPHHQQETANAWVTRMMNAGNIVGFLIGYADTPRILPFFGDSHFKVLCTIAFIIMVVTVCISCGFIAEPQLPTQKLAQATGGLLSILKSIIASVRGLPPHIRRICIVQVWTWIAWFPYLFYATTYVGELYADPILRERPNMSEEEIERVYEQGTREGTFALLIQAIVSFSVSVIVPLLIQPTFASPSEGSGRSPSSQIPSSSSNKSRGRAWLSLTWLHIPGLDLTLTWLLSHLLFTVLMFSTFLVNSVSGAIFVVVSVGICWAITNWVPFALVAQEVSMRDAQRRALRTNTAANDDNNDDNDDDNDEPRPDDPSSTNEDEAGVLLGILNVAISAPQIIASLVASAIFKFFQKPRGVPGDTSVAWVFRFSGVCSLAAAWFTRQVRVNERAAATGN